MERYIKLNKKLRYIYQDPKAQIITSDTSIPWTSKFKPGGTAKVITSKVSSYVTNKENDYPMGRWSMVNISLKKHKICICTAYIVGSIEIIPNKHLTAAYQQWKIMSKNNNTQHPREQAMSDITKKSNKK